MSGATGGAVVVVVGIVVLAFGCTVAALESPEELNASAAPITATITSAPIPTPTSNFVCLDTHISLSRLIRSSSGGCVSNKWLKRDRASFLLSSAGTSSGCSIHICAVALVA